MAWRGVAFLVSMAALAGGAAHAAERPAVAPSMILPAPAASSGFALPADHIPAPGPVAAPAAQLPAPASQTQAAGAPAGAKKPPPPLRFAAVSKDPRPTLDPDTFVNTMRAAERYHALAAAGGWGELPKGATFKLGDKGQLVVKLKERLAATGDLSAEAVPGEVFDQNVLAAVKR
ncbi:MAG TPA: murein L,D-transpeptidase, partial [Beijerinckiaceae bacterium]|nr:murein L,D-transpeptidase [Beijerinckiaceae bacterium]